MSDKDTAEILAQGIGLHFKAGNFDESKHPRADNGEFTESGYVHPKDSGTDVKKMTGQELSRTYALYRFGKYHDSSRAIALWNEMGHRDSVKMGWDKLGENDVIGVGSRDGKIKRPGKK